MSFIFIYAEGEAGLWFGGITLKNIGKIVLFALKDNNGLYLKPQLICSICVALANMLKTEKLQVFLWLFWRLIFGFSLVGFWSGMSQFPVGMSWSDRVSIGIGRYPQSRLGYICIRAVDVKVCLWVNHAGFRACSAGYDCCFEMSVGCVFWPVCWSVVPVERGS